MIQNRLFISSFSFSDNWKLSILFNYFDCKNQLINLKLWRRWFYFSQELKKQFFPNYKIWHSLLQNILNENIDIFLKIIENNGFKYKKEDEQIELVNFSISFLDKLKEKLGINDLKTELFNQLEVDIFENEEHIDFDKIYNLLKKIWTSEEHILIDFLETNKIKDLKKIFKNKEYNIRSLYSQLMLNSIYSPLESSMKSEQLFYKIFLFEKGFEDLVSFFNQLEINEFEELIFEKIFLAFNQKDLQFVKFKDLIENYMGVFIKGRVYQDKNSNITRIEVVLNKKLIQFLKEKWIDEIPLYLDTNSVKEYKKLKNDIKNILQKSWNKILQQFWIEQVNELSNSYVYGLYFIKFYDKIYIFEETNLYYLKLFWEMLINYNSLNLDKINQFVSSDINKILENCFVIPTKSPNWEKVESFLKKEYQIIPKDFTKDCNLYDINNFVIYDVINFKSKFDKECLIDKLKKLKNGW